MTAGNSGCRHDQLSARDTPQWKLARHFDLAWAVACFASMAMSSRTNLLPRESREDGAARIAPFHAAEQTGREDEESEDVRIERCDEQARQSQEQACSIDVSGNDGEPARYYMRRQCAAVSQGLVACRPERQSPGLNSAGERCPKVGGGRDALSCSIEGILTARTERPGPPQASAN